MSTGTHKKIEQIPFLSSQKTKKRAVQKGRKILDYNFFPLTKQHTHKKLWPNPTHTKKGQLESLDFHPCQLITRFPHIPDEMVSEVA